AMNLAAAQGPCRGAWAEGNTYNVGDSVTYNGATYTCLQTHTAFVGANWNPAATPSLWRTGGSCTGGPTPTPPPLQIPPPQHPRPRLRRRPRLRPHRIPAQVATGFQCGPLPRSSRAASARV